MAIEKTEVISVRFTPTEAQQVTQKAKKAGVAKSTYLRELAVGRISQDTADFSAYDHTEALQNLRKELMRIGTNINQMARIANTTGSIHGERLNQIKKDLGSVNDKILDTLI